jgi:DNA-binding NarL/FixJ family response regulator
MPAKQSGLLNSNKTDRHPCNALKLHYRGGFAFLDEKIKPGAMRIAIVDNLRLMHEALKSMLEELEPEAEIIGFCNPAAFTENLSHKSFDCVFLDLHLNEINSTDLCILIKTRQPDARVYFLSGDTSLAAFREAVASGADGLIARNANKEEVRHAISAKQKNLFYTGNSMPLSDERKELIASMSLINSREKYILRMLATGFTYQEIATNLRLSHRAIDIYRRRMLSKLGLNNTNELIHFALKNHLI